MLGLGQRRIVLLFVQAELGLHAGFFVEHLADRGGLVSTVFLIGERLEGPIEGKR